MSFGVHRGTMSGGCWKGPLLALFVVALLIMDTGSASAQSCTWSGTSTVVPPSVTALRAYRNLLRSPGRVAVDGAGRVYVTDPASDKVVVRDRWGRLSSVVEGFATPLGIAVDATGRIYVGEQASGRVLVFDQQWTFLDKLGAGDPEFLVPNDIAIDRDTGEVYVVDSGASRVRVYSGDGTLLRLFGQPGTGAGQFRFPVGIHVSGGEVFVGDQRNNRVQVFTPTGAFLRCFGKSSSFSARFGTVEGIAGDSGGRIYVADAFQGLVHVFDRRGFRLGAVGRFGDGPGQLRTPTDVAIDAHNRLFVTSANNARVEVFGIDAFSDPRVIAAVVDVKPDVVTRPGTGVISVYVEMRDQRLEDVDPATVTANGVPAQASPIQIGDWDADGVPDLTVAFDAAAVVAPLADGDAIVVVSGQFRNGDPFEGADTLRVIEPPLSPPPIPAPPPPPPPVPAVVHIEPRTLNRSSERRFITADIQIPGYPTSDVDVATMTANGVPASPSPVAVESGDTPRLIVKFDGDAVLAGLTDGNAVIIVAGRFRDGTAFSGTASVRVLSSHGGRR